MLTGCTLVWKNKLVKSILPRLENGYGFIHGFTHGNPQGYGYGYGIGQKLHTHIHIHTCGKVQKPVGKPLVADISPSFLTLVALDGNKC